MYVAYPSCFLATEDSELQVERLEEELEAAKRSPGTGLALR